MKKKAACAACVSVGPKQHLPLAGSHDEGACRRPHLCIYQCHNAYLQLGVIRAAIQPPNRNYKKCVVACQSRKWRNCEWGAAHLWKCSVDADRKITTHL